MNALLFVFSFFRDEIALFFKRLLHRKISILLFETVFELFPVQIDAEPVRGQLPAVFPFAETDGFRIRNFDQKVNFHGLHPVGDAQAVPLLSFIAEVFEGLQQQIPIRKSNFHYRYVRHNETMKNDE